MQTRTSGTLGSGSSGSASTEIACGFVLLEGEETYRISGQHRIAPFLMNLASDTDLWMFITSNGGVTAGRVDAEGSLFPYLTSDQLQDSHRHTGPVTLIRVQRESGPGGLWEPFSDRLPGSSDVVRNLYKNTIGTRITFEEIEPVLGLVFRYRWAACDDFGWVRTAMIENVGDTPVRISLLDGLRNILPWGVPLGLQQQAGNLVDAYKKSEVDFSTGLGIFSLTAGITDRPEALEVLRANAVWCCGLDSFSVHLPLGSIDGFRSGQGLSDLSVLNGERGNYLISSRLGLEPGHSIRWHIVADAGRDHVQLLDLARLIDSGGDLGGQIDTCLRQSDENLRRIVASADGLQLTGQPIMPAHHFANVLFNSMRGGIFLQNEDVPVADFVRLLWVRNRSAAGRHGTRLAMEPEFVPVHRLREVGCSSGDADLARLAHDYLPLYFGRRHGDPSRPWNRFEIRVRSRNGERVLHHEGNWRDIFQNWEALAVSFPGYLPGMVSRFVSASTVDGFNPYRITQEGVDWEVPAPDDPWSSIGYWGDHQIVYLLRLLDAMDRYDPSSFSELLDADIFSYADVPYRIKPYEEILLDPRATIEFDSGRAALIDQRVGQIGTDGRLLPGPDGAVYHANLLEKLLVPALSKISNLVPGAGIWMNTQRPEWNDANNALGAGGVSVVTLCHLRRYLEFLRCRLESVPRRELPVSTEIVRWFNRTAGIIDTETARQCNGPTSPRERKRIMDLFSGSFSDYRKTVYARGYSGRSMLDTGRCAEFCRAAISLVDPSISANRREDGLYHTYNRLEFSDDVTEVEVVRLPEMLEGQVAVLSSGAIEPSECLGILESLFNSDLYRPDQRSFLLYPERKLPGFMARNAIPEDAIAAIPVMGRLQSAGNGTLWVRDGAGVGRFHGDIRNSRDVAAILDDLGRDPEWHDLIARDRAAIIRLFEEVFGHRLYTGRSAAMYGYEGIGCIYWHMVAKLLLAVQETALRAVRESLPPPVRLGLAGMYFRVLSGLGVRKTAAEFGAFPTDPYSHTPSSGGAKQPGMTGQVKEEILTRFGELGVRVEEGTIRFEPFLLPASEFIEEPVEFHYFDVKGRDRTLLLPARSLAFTFCQVPVCYHLVDDDPRIRITLADGSLRYLSGSTLESGLSKAVFRRSGRIDQIRVDIPNGVVYEGEPGA